MTVCGNPSHLESPYAHQAALLDRGAYKAASLADDGHTTGSGHTRTQTSCPLHFPPPPTPRHCLPTTTASSSLHQTSHGLCPRHRKAHSAPESPPRLQPATAGAQLVGVCPCSSTVQMTGWDSRAVCSWGPRGSMKAMPTFSRFNPTTAL